MFAARSTSSRKPGSTTSTSFPSARGPARRRAHAAGAAPSSCASGRRDCAAAGEGGPCRALGRAHRQWRASSSKGFGRSEPNLRRRSCARRGARALCEHGREPVAGAPGAGARSEIVARTFRRMRKPERSRSDRRRAGARAPAPRRECVAREPEPKAAGSGASRRGCARSSRLSEGIGAIVGRRRLDEATLDELEELLIGADLGVDARREFVARLRRTRFNQEVSAEEVRTALAEEVIARCRAGGPAAPARQRRQAVRDPGRRRQRQRQDHHHRQARAALSRRPARA